MWVTIVCLLVLLPFSPIPKVRYYGCFLVYIVMGSIASIIVLPVFLLRPRNVINFVIGSETLKHVSRLLGVEWQARGLHVLEVERGAVIVANHQTMLDILGMCHIWRAMGKCAAVAKKELFYAWPFGLSAWLSGMVFIDRRGGTTQLIGASRLVTKEKTKVWMFPEGTRNNNPETMMPFKKGAFRIAIDFQVPILPVVFSPYYFIDHEKKTFGKGTVIIQCLEPVSTEGKTTADVDAVMADVRARMEKQLDELRREVTAPRQPAS